MPTAKTAAAVCSQAPVVVHNILRQMEHKESTAKYYGYSSCAAFVGDNKAMLIEFKYNGLSDETFFKDQTQPSRIFYYMKTKIIPKVYFNLLPKGLWFGRNAIFKPKFES